MDELDNVSLIDSKEVLTPAKVIVKNNQYIIYYFSASWCLPCIKLLQTMKKIHTESTTRKLSLEIIYISLDTDEPSMMQQFKEKHGRWYAIPFGDSAIQELKLRYGVSHIPFVVVLKTDGTIITTNGKKEIEDLGVNVLITWIT